jgi:mannose-6-phosphate isomerase
VEQARELEGRIRHYDWGSRHVLARLQGRPTPTSRPEAELWFGGHEAAPSRVRTGEAWLPLPDWIEQAPERRLGVQAVARFGPRLPFLVKLLAIERPLSLQVHPDADQAARGFEREEARGIPRDARERVYRDPFAKPELVCALTRFSALVGPGRPEELAERLVALGLANRVPGAAELRARPGDGTLAALWRSLLELDPDRRRSLVEAAARTAEEQGDDPRARWVGHLARAHPEDAGVLAPWLLDVVTLAPGQALYLPPGVLHVYLAGFGLEVMAPSDNVVRAGLTGKHRDVDELMRVARFGGQRSLAVRPKTVSPWEVQFTTPACEFELRQLRVAPGSSHEPPSAAGVAVLLNVEGAVSVTAPGSGDELRVSQGRAAVVPADAPALDLRGEGRLFRVGLPASTPERNRALRGGPLEFP